MLEAQAFYFKMHAFLSGILSLLSLLLSSLHHVLEAQIAGVVDVNV